MLRPRLRRTIRSAAVIDFLRHDKALPDFITFTRADAAPCATRRRINGSVGPSRTNLFTESEFRNGVTDAPTRGGGALLTAATMTGYAGALFFGWNGVDLPYAYKSNFSAVAGQQYTLSVIVEMTDGNAPVFGSEAGNNVANDFVLVLTGSPLSGLTLQVQHLEGSRYRVSGSRVAGSTNLGNNGVLKYSTNSTRTFKVTAYQFEVGPQATPYIPTTTAAVTTTDWPRTNKCLARNANPVNATGAGGLTQSPGAAVITLVDDRVALEAAGLHGICTSGRVYKIDNSASGVNADVRPGGAVPVNANYTYSAWVRGSGNFHIGTNPAAWATNSAGASYTRVKDTHIVTTTPGADAGLTFRVLPGTVLYVILFQAEEGSAATAVIPNDTGAAKTVTTPPYGDLEVLAANAPRIEYTTDGLPRGLLIEPSRGNGAHSDFNGQAEGSVAADISSGQPFGTTCILSKDVVPLYGELALKHKFGGGPDTNVGTVMGYAAADGNLVGRMAVWIPSAYAGTYVNVAWEGGVGITEDPAGYSRSANLALRDQWQFIAAKASLTGGATQSALVLRVDDTTPFYSCCWQTEEGSVPTSFIANTTAAALTRAAESAVITNLASINWNAGGWSAMVEWEQQDVHANSYGTPLFVASADESDYLQLFVDPAGLLYVKVNDDWLNVFQQSPGTAVIGINRAAISVTTQGVTASLNGSAPATYLGSVPMASFVKATLGTAGDATTYLRGYLRRFKAWNRVLSQGELQAQSTL